MLELGATSDIVGGTIIRQIEIIQCFIDEIRGE